MFPYYITSTKSKFPMRFCGYKLDVQAPADTKKLCTPKHASTLLLVAKHPNTI